MIDPTALFGGGILTEHNESPRFAYDSSGMTLTHTYDSFAGVTPDALINAGWVIGGYHWLMQGQSIYTKVRFTGFTIERSRDDRFYHTVTANFAFPYSPAMNRFGELWEYLQTTEMAEVYSVTDSADQTTYGPASEGMEDGVAGVERAIGVDGDQIHGTQAYRPSAALRVTKIWAAMPASAYLDTVDRLKRTVNSGPWPIGAPGDPPLRQYKAREVLFTGATLRKNNDGNIQMDYDFLTAPQPDDEDVTLADGTVVTVKRDPWDHVSYRYVLGPNFDGLRRGIQEVNVAKLYEAKSFPYSFNALELVGSI